MGTIIGVMFALVPWQMAITFVLALIVTLTTKNSIWAGMALFIPLSFICLLSYFLLDGPPLSVVAYTVLLPCLSGFTHWLTTRHLSSEAKKESETFWIGDAKSRQG